MSSSLAASQGLDARCLLLPSIVPPRAFHATMFWCLEGELPMPRRRLTTRISLHSTFEWSNYHQMRCRLAHGELHPSFSFSFRLAHFPLPFSPEHSLILGGTLLLTSTFASIFGRGADSTFLQLSGRPGIHCLWPIAPWHAQEVRRPFLPMDLSISESVHCSAPARDKSTRNNSRDFYLRRWVRAVERFRLPWHGV